MLIYAGVLVQSICCILHESVVCKESRHQLLQEPRSWTTQHKGLEWKRIERDLRSFSASNSQHCGLSLFETPFSVLVINTDLKLSCFSGALKCGACFVQLCVHKGINVDFYLLKECIAKRFKG